MVDIDGFNPFDEDGILAKYQIDFIRDRLEYIVDRLYDKEITADFDEIDYAIRSMADVLAVYVPKTNLSQYQKFGFEYIEDVIDAELYNVKKLFSGWNPNAAFQFLKTLKIEKEHEILSVGDIADFCFSNYFKQKCEEVGNVF